NHLRTLPVAHWIHIETDKCARNESGIRLRGGTFDSIFDIAQTLPPHLLLSLIYRLAVLHLAARIVPVIRKSSMGYDDGMDGAVASGFWDGRSLGEEP
nr:hypothetical protein [Tanacetum cinerariifolium]